MILREIKIGALKLREIILAVMTPIFTKQGAFVVNNCKQKVESYFWDNLSLVMINLYRAALLRMKIYIYVTLPLSRN